MRVLLFLLNHFRENECMGAGKYNKVDTFALALCADARDVITNVNEWFVVTREKLINLVSGKIRMVLPRGYPWELGSQLVSFPYIH